MNDSTKDISEIDKKIQELKIKKKKIKQNIERNLRLRSNNCGKSNTPIRVSLNFKDRLDIINKKRSENGLDYLSGPKTTELIIRHKNCWKIIEDDISRYNTMLDEDKDKEEGEFNNE